MKLTVACERPEGNDASGTPGEGILIVFVSSTESSRDGDGDQDGG